MIMCDQVGSKIMTPGRVLRTPPCFLQGGRRWLKTCSPAVRALRRTHRQRRRLAQIHLHINLFDSTSQRQNRTILSRAETPNRSPRNRFLPGKRPANRTSAGITLRAEALYSRCSTI